MNGNLCGASTGEALSRWCAMVVSNNALSDFVTAPTWFQAGMHNWVDQTDPTDRNSDSTGCAVAFISWLLSLGSTLGAIAQGMVALGDSGTLAQLYANLRGDAASNAWPNFKAAVQGLAGGITNDDPFGGSSNAHAMAASMHAVLNNAAAAGARGLAACSTRSRRLLPPGRVV